MNVFKPFFSHLYQGHFYIFCELSFTFFPFSIKFIILCPSNFKCSLYITHCHLYLQYMLQIFSASLSVIFLLYCVFQYADVYVVRLVNIFFYSQRILNHRKSHLIFRLEKNLSMFSSDTNMVLLFICISPVLMKTVLLNYTRYGPSFIFSQMVTLLSQYHS